MMDFIPRKLANLIWQKLEQRDGIAVISGEFDHVSMATVENMDHRAHVVHSQAVFGQVDVQSHTIQFSDHQTKDTR